MPNADRYSGVYGRVLIVLALGFLAGLVLPVTCRGQALPRTDRSVDLAARQGSPFPGEGAVALLNLRNVNAGRRQAGIADVAKLHQAQRELFSHPEAVAHGSRFHASNIVAPRPKFHYLLPLGATGLGYLGGIIDRDPGGYKDSFRLQPDKEAHFLASVVLSKAVADGTSVKLGFTTCLLAGLAWEAGQARHHGFASKYDATYDFGGCATGALWGRK